jgi:riboflavin kinase/FMN adenylyltransferase
LKIFNSIQAFHSNKKTIVTIGTFDGVHVGHKKILERITHSAETLDCESLVLTFFPHPRMVLHENSEMKQLNTIDEKCSLLEMAGIDNLIIHPFDKDFSRLTAEDFVKQVLIEKFNLKKIIIGHDHRFGRNRTANIDDLVVFGKTYGFEVEQISAEEIDDVAISSTKIRNALLEGNTSLATEYLGYNYILTGTVVKGKQLGRTIGFPTANIQIQEDYKLIPKSGVYIVKSTINSKVVFGMMNIGVNPTVDGTSQTIEIHFFDYNGNLYNQKITIALLQRIRSEQKFKSVEALKDQLAIDKETALSFISKM